MNANKNSAMGNTLSNVNKNSAMGNTLSNVNDTMTELNKNVNKANSTLSTLGTKIKNFGNSRENLDISWNTIGVITLLGLTYIIASSVGIGIFAKCDKFKGKKIQEDLNKLLIGTLGVAIAIPFTLSMTKLFSNETPVFMLVYAIMGIIGSSVALNWSVNCENDKKKSVTSIALSLTSFIVMLLTGIFLIAPIGKKLNVE